MPVHIRFARSLAKQLIVEDFPQFSQCVADRGCAPAQSFSGPRDACIDQERVEGHEQIGVDLFKMHFIQLFG